MEVQPDLVNGGGTIVWEWHIWDHLVQQFDATKANWHGPTGVADHPELIDLNYVSTFDEGGGQPEDWTHSNGIDYNADLDQIVLSVREFSEFWIIDHSTTTAEAASHSGGNSGHGGDLLYRWGNPQTYDRGTAADRQLYYQHDAHWIAAGLPGAGDITVFNNGTGRPGDDFSQAVEITPPVDENGNYPLAAGQAYGPAAATWTYSAPAANFSPIISSAQRLPNGNTLIDYGVMGNFTEVTPDGQEVWKYVNPYTGFGTLGPTQAIPSLGLDRHRCWTRCLSTSRFRRFPTRRITSPNCNRPSKVPRWIHTLTPIAPVRGPGHGERRSPRSPAASAAESSRIFCVSVRAISAPPSRPLHMIRERPWPPPPSSHRTSSSSPGGSCSAS